MRHQYAESSFVLSDTVKSYFSQNAIIFFGLKDPFHLRFL